MNYTVRNNQNLIDIAVTNYGSEWIRGLEMIIEHNDVNLVDELIPGTELVIKDVNPNDLQLQYLQARGINVVTGNYTVDVADPSNLVAEAVSENQVDLSWDDNSDNEFGFEVWRATGSGAFALVKTLLPDTESWSDTDVEAGQTYKYKVRANVIFTDVATMTVPFYAPTALIASPVSENSIYLSWTDNSNAETGYEIWRSLDGETYSRIATVYDSFEFTDSDELQPDTTYWYKVRAVNAASASDFSDDVSAKTFNAFVSVWKTDNAGTSNDNQITLPLVATGTYAMIVAWGDGQRDLISAYNQPEITHTYAAPGTYEVKVYGIIQGFRFNNGGDKLKITEISKWGDFSIAIDSTFYGCANLDVTALDTPTLTQPDALENHFRDCVNLVYNSSIGHWNISTASTLKNVLRGCSMFNHSIDNWDVSNVIDFTLAFAGCSIYNMSLNSWDVSAGLNMGQMFAGCISYNQPMNNWDVSMNNSFNEFLKNCISFNSSLAGWSIRNGADLRQMFFNCDVLNQDLTSWTFGGTSGHRVESMFEECIAYNSSLNSGDWIVTFTPRQSNKMFKNASSYNQSMSGWDTSNMNDQTELFSGCSALNQNFNSWGGFTNSNSFSNFFQNCISYNNGGVAPNYALGSTGANCNGFFDNCQSLTVDVSGIDFSKVRLARNMFRSINVNVNVGAYDTSLLEDIDGMFKNNHAFDRDLSGWIVTNLSNAAAFLNNTGLSTANYDALLISWESQLVQNNVPLDAGNSNYTIGGAADTARADLIADHLWTIIDGGGI